MIFEISQNFLTSLSCPVILVRYSIAGYGGISRRAGPTKDPVTALGREGSNPLASSKLAGQLFLCNRYA